ncbi:P-loop containing nucleoside triphosphate hydrolase protein [Mytilinidion resinicola]|uniref:P-loop containing nucleoside triphosphate hydrolase protein n=1 Tax=Mytilinidion resinicola TaxID=574789 RepID=A0A6A6YRW4_9PEZI|nr:P-loop containing nucleoside triphosphate hydrolase protein [Mytilinidion resinicola]KAF2810784.1 P-loop containing nucleoside triphosphate hydrolase protein [Mytilinidion resinicola]
MNIHFRSSSYLVSNSKLVQINPYFHRNYHTGNSNVIHHEDSTIYALSTAPGKAAIAVIRISGPACLQIYQSLCPSKPLPKPRHATLRRLYTPHLLPSPSTILDSGALILYFPSPSTVTGEDVLELHLHGGPAIVRAVLAAIPSSLPASHSLHTPPRIRYAEPGEFTRRAFTNNRIDLPQIEALGDSLSASTERQRQLAVRGTTAALAARYEHWRQLLLLARGELEALIDFSEDQHFDESPAALCASVAGQILRLRRQMEAQRANAVRGELLRSGIGVALLGAPNAGKSSLLNRIVGREAVIVAAEAGTTRDVVEVGVDLGGWLVRLGDMAGLRRAGLAGGDVGEGGGGPVGVVEQEGIKRAKQRALESDVLIVVQDASRDIDPEVKVTAKECVDLGINVVVAINKVDKLSNATAAEARWKEMIQSALDVPSDRIFFISCRNAVNSDTNSSEPDPGNIQFFLQGLISTFKSMTSALIPDSDTTDDIPGASIWQESLGATERQRVLLSECLDHLDTFLTAVGAADIAPYESQQLSQDPLWEGKLAPEIEVGDEPAIDIVIAAESLRAAADSMARITGRGDAGDVEEVLGVVFEK